MPVTIVATVGSASANSFVTLAEAAAYMTARLNSSTWDSATTDEQNRALVEATRDLSNLSWLGLRADTTQALSWPRQWCPNPDGTGFSWDYYVTTVIPQRVKDASCELAFQFLEAGTTDVASRDPDQGVIEKTVDVLTTRWSPYARSFGLARFPRVIAYVRPLLAMPGQQPALVRG